MPVLPQREHVVRGELRRTAPRPWGFWYSLAAGILKPVLAVLTRSTWRGATRVPRTGGVVLAANHVSLLDPCTLADFCVYGAGRLPSYLAKSSLFKVFFVGSVLRGARQIPVYRDRPDGGGALDAAVQALHDGACVVIYPEGTTTKDPDGWPMRARTGVARLALESGAPVLPVAQWGPQALLPPHGKPRLRLRAPVTTVVGEPVDLSPWAGKPLDAQVLREVTDAVMAAVTELLASVRGEAAPAEPFDPRAGRRGEDAQAA